MTLNENIAVQNEDGIAISSDNTYRFSNFVDSGKTDFNIQSGSKKRYSMDDLFRRSENEKAYTDEEIEYSYNHGDVKSGQISKKLWQKMKDIRSGKLPKEKLQYENKSAPDIGKPKLHTDKKPTIKITQRQRQKGDDYFLTLERGVIRNASYRELFKGPGIVYEWLLANIVRDQWKDSKAYPIREKYYNSGYLAYCSTYGKKGYSEKELNKKTDAVKKQFTPNLSGSMAKFKTCLERVMRKKELVYHDHDMLN